MQHTTRSSPASSTAQVVPCHTVRAADAQVKVIVPAAAGGAGQPDVQVIQDGDIVRSIQITCSCGEKMTIICEYKEK